MAYGINAVLGMAFQTSYGSSAGVSSAQWFQFNSESVGIKKPPLVSQAMRGVFDEAPTYEGPNTVEGTFAIDARAADLGYLLKASVGSAGSVTAIGSGFTHHFKPVNRDFDDKSAMVPFTLFKYLGVGSGDSFPDLNGSTLELSIANGELAQATLGVVGGRYAQTSLSNNATSYYTSDRIAWDVASLQIGGAAIDFGSAITITIDNKLEAKHALRVGKFPSAIKRTGTRTISVNGTLRFESHAEKLAYLNQTERNLTLHLQGITNISSGVRESLTVIVPAFRYTDHPDAANGPTDLEVGFTGVAKYDTSSATAIHFILTCARSAF